MTDPVEKKPRETVAERMARLGLKREPEWTMPKNRFYLTRRIRKRESDEGWFTKPNPNKTDNEK